MKTNKPSYEELQKQIVILKKTIEVQHATINRLLDTYVVDSSNKEK